MPTYRVRYIPRPGVRLLIEDVEADAVRQTPVHWVLIRYVLVVGRPREIVALRAARRDVAAVLRLCVVTARWGCHGETGDRRWPMPGSSRTHP